MDIHIRFLVIHYYRTHLRPTFISIQEYIDNNNISSVVYFGFPFGFPIFDSAISKSDDFMMDIYCDIHTEIIPYHMRLSMIYDGRDCRLLVVLVVWDAAYKYKTAKCLTFPDLHSVSTFLSLFLSFPFPSFHSYTHLIHHTSLFLHTPRSACGANQRSSGNEEGDRFCGSFGISSSTTTTNTITTTTTSSSSSSA